MTKNEKLAESIAQVHALLHELDATKPNATKKATKQTNRLKSKCPDRYLIKSRLDTERAYVTVGNTLKRLFTATDTGAPNDQLAAIRETLKKDVDSFADELTILFGRLD